MNRVTLEKYIPRSVKPNLEDIPAGYRPCEMLGTEALLDFCSLVTCSVKCPYGNQISASVAYEEEDKAKFICLTKGLVKITE